MRPIGSPSPKRAATRLALIETAKRLIAERGIDATSVLDITQTLGVSNGSFYYHFENKDRLLEVIGHDTILELVDRIRSVGRRDPAARIARGPLSVFSQVDRHPEQTALILRVLDDPAERHRDLAESLIADIQSGVAAGRFVVEDHIKAALFARSILTTGIRQRHLGDRSARLPIQTAVHTLAMLGVPICEAVPIVEREHDRLEDDTDD